MPVLSALASKTVLKLDSHIHFDPMQFTQNEREMMREALTWPNPEKELAIRERMWNAELLPDTISVYQDGVLPRGFLTAMRAGLKQLGHELAYLDDRALVSVDTSRWKPVKLRSYQKAAVDAMSRWEQGMWQAPPGSGKTVGMLELARQLGQRTLVITNKSNIARQWVERSKQFLDYEPGVVGDGEFDVRDITVALIQTLWSRKEHLDLTEWWSNFGLVVFDECHHLPALTWYTVAQKFPALYRFGVSGTPEWTPGSLEPMIAALGEIVHTTTDAELLSANVLVEADVKVHRTGFTFPYHTTHDHVPGTACRVPNCARSRNAKVHRNNYTAMMGELVKDSDRNFRIVSEIAHAFVQGRTQIVLSSRLAHLDALKDSVGKVVGSQQLFLFTGRESSEERARVVEEAEKGGCVIFSTIGDEALDIPRLDTVHLAYPTANVKKIEQQVGRVLRLHPDKLEPVVHDYADLGISVLRRQFWGRHEELYRKKGWNIEGISIHASLSP